MDFSASNGKCIWTKDYGYEPGDQVELLYMPGEDRPRQLFINGIEKDVSIQI